MSNSNSSSSPIHALFLLGLLAALLHQGSSDGTQRQASKAYHRDFKAQNSGIDPFYGRPFFGNSRTEVLVQEGNHAFFHCAVHNLANQTVSWVRNADSHILFIGNVRFVRDDRYELIQARHGKWTLKLKYVTAQDAGKFECQVSTVPKISQTYSLKVVVPAVKILGDREVFVRSGTPVLLRCLISNVLDVPAYVFWYHGDRRLLDKDDTEYDDDNSSLSNDIVIRTQRVPGDGAAISQLTIAKPMPRHSGMYSCRPANLEAAAVSLHVIKAEKPAAMQHENRGVAAVAEASATSTGTRVHHSTMTLSLSGAVLGLFYLYMSSRSLLNERGATSIYN